MKYGTQVRVVLTLSYRADVWVGNVLNKSQGDQAYIVSLNTS